MNYRALIKGLSQARIIVQGKGHTPQQPEYLVSTPLQIHTAQHTEEISAGETLIVYSPDKEPTLAIYRPTNASFIDAGSISSVSVAAPKAPKPEPKKVLPHEAAGFGGATVQPQAQQPQNVDPIAAQ